LLTHHFPDPSPFTNPKAESPFPNSSAYSLAEFSAIQPAGKIIRRM